MTSAFAAWQNFYVIVGSAAGAMTGLQFVVIALVVNSPINRDVSRATAAYGTPTIFHFGAVLILSAILSAPWSGSLAPLLLLGGCGAAGFAYVLVVAARARTTEYRPVFEDWLFHVLLPGSGYCVLTAAAASVIRWPLDNALFAMAAVSLVLLCVGIHNAWDTVTYVVAVRSERADDDVGPRR